MKARSGATGGRGIPRGSSGPARRRRLDPEEEALWRAVARSARPLHPATRPAAPPGGETPAEHPPGPRPGPRPEPWPEPLAQPAAAPAIPAPIAPFRIGAAARPLAAPAPPAHKAPDVPDRRMAERLRRGKEGPEARIDLHGLTLAEAHPALVAFIVGAHAAGLRVVLVITGKGRDRDEGGPIPTPRGVLRHHLPRWLAQAPLARIVQTATPSHHRHGGEGAWYVWLRRARPDPRGRTG